MNYINENIKFVDVGNGNFVSVSRVVSVVTPDSLPIRRMMQDPMASQKLI